MMHPSRQAYVEDDAQVRSRQRLPNRRLFTLSLSRLHLLQRVLETQGGAQQLIAMSHVLGCRDGSGSRQHP